MKREAAEIIGMTFGLIGLVLVLTKFTGFSDDLGALGNAYKSVVGAFITPTQA